MERITALVDKLVIAEDCLKVELSSIIIDWHSKLFTHRASWKLCMDSVLNEESKTIAFLYKLKVGESPKSYSLSVARVAGIPESLLKIAQEKAEEVENAQELIMITGLFMRLKKGYLKQ